MQKHRLAAQPLHGDFILPLAVNGEHLAEAVSAMLSSEHNPDLDYARHIAFIAALELQAHDLDLTIALANHFIAEVRKVYAADRAPFDFAQVFAEGLKAA